MSFTHANATGDDLQSLIVIGRGVHAQHSSTIRQVFAMALGLGGCLSRVTDVRTPGLSASLGVPSGTRGPGLPPISVIWSPPAPAALEGFPSGIDQPAPFRAIELCATMASCLQKQQQQPSTPVGVGV